MNFKIGDKVTYCGNNNYLKLHFCQEYEGQEINVGEVVDIFKSNYFGGPVIKVEFKNGYLAGREDDFSIYEESKNKEEKGLIYMAECIQETEDKAKFFICGKDEGSMSFEIDLKEGFGETSEEKFLGALVAAIEKTSPGLISKFMSLEEAENCCCEDECICDEDCDCKCDICNCSNKEEKEDVEAYSGKIYCVKSGYDYITEGKIYKIVNGGIEADDGWIIRITTKTGKEVPTTFKEISEYLRGEWIEVEESDEDKEVIAPPTYEANIICVKPSRIENFTKGKIYKVENGFLYDNKKNKVSWYGSPFKHIDAINSYCTSIFKEIKN